MLVFRDQLNKIYCNLVCNGLAIVDKFHLERVSKYACIFNTYLDVIRRCAGSSRTWEFQWKHILPKEVQSSCASDDKLNPFCISEARVNIHPDAIEKVAAILLPKNFQQENNSCIGENWNFAIGFTKDLPTYTTKGRFVRARECAFVDLTAAFRNKVHNLGFIQGNIWPMLVVEFKRPLLEEQVKKVLPFITVEMPTKAARENELCMNEIYGLQHF